MQVHRSRRLDIGPEWISVQQQNQRCPLVQLVGDGPLPDELPGLLQERGRKAGLIAWCGAWHGIPPAVDRICVRFRLPSSLSALGR